MKELILFPFVSEPGATIAAAVISVLGVALTAFISVKNIKKESFNKRVTEERIRWLNKMRELYGIIIAAWNMKKASHNNYFLPNFDTNFYNEKMVEAEKAKAEFISRLNTSTYFGNEYNFFIKKVLMEMKFIENIDDFQVFEEKIERMNVYVNKMLENEWKKSKKETK